MWYKFVQRIVNYRQYCTTLFDLQRFSAVCMAGERMFCVKLLFYWILVVFDKDLPKVSYLKDGNDGEIGTDEQYPEWLWNLKGNKQTLDELDQHSRTYSRILRKRQRRDENERRKMKRFWIVPIVNLLNYACCNINMSLNFLVDNFKVFRCCSTQS